MKSVDRVLKALDALVAAVGLVVASPVLVAAGIGIKLTTRGPVLYRAARAGVGGAPFTMYKLRTMYVDREQDGRVTSGVDARVFPLGRTLRRFKIDELPQLFNVLRGQMALVGPRPEDVVIVRDHFDSMMRESLKVPPGVTSVGTLHYYAEESALPDHPGDAERVYLESLLPRKVALDLVYVDNRTVAYAFEILLRTGLGIVGRHEWFTRKMEWERQMAADYLRERRRSDS